MAGGTITRAAAPLLAVLVSAGCGGQESGTTTSTASRAATAFVTQPRRAIVSMRAYSPESLMWQTVSLSADGSGILTTLIGEISGAERRSFRLPARQASTLRRLVTRARPVPQPTAHDPRAELYSVRIAGAPSKTVQGRARAQLEALVRFLSGLMQTYCC